MEDPYLEKILNKHYKKEVPPTYLREKSKCTKKEAYHVFAKAIDKFGKYHYLSANNEDEIEKYCEGGLLSNSIAVCEYSYNVVPIMAAHHFKWIGKGRNPYRLSKPHDYENPTKRPLEKW